MNKITLKWKRRGYQPEDYYWDNYVLSTSVHGLRHDFYHHQRFEKGTDEEELRALGGRHRFDNCHLLIKDNLEYIYERVLWKQAKAFHFREEYINEDILDTVESVGISYPTYYAVKLSEGLQYAKKYGIEEYEEFFKIDFEAFHARRLNVSVDLSTGKVLDRYIKPWYDF